MMKDLDSDNIKVLQQNKKERHLAIFNTQLQSDELKNKATIDFPTSYLAKTGIIPGLYVYDEFITECKVYLILIFLEEETDLIHSLDEKQWIKLLNRRVQHYGFEFVYGANNVDKTRKLGDMPDFLSNIIGSMLTM